MQSRPEWPEIIRPLAPRIRAAIKTLDILWSPFHLVNAAIACVVCYGEHQLELGRRMTLGDLDLDPGNYLFFQDNKFRGFKMVNLAERLEILTLKTDMLLHEFLPHIVKHFIAFALVNRETAVDLIYIVHELARRDDPDPLRACITLDLPQWLLDWCNDDKCGGETDAEFITRTLRESVLARRGYQQKEAA